MRTRRNPKAQERLWRALGGAPEKTSAESALADRIASEERAIASPHVSASAKAVARRALARLRAQAALKAGAA